MYCDIITHISMGEWMLRRVWQDIEMNMADVWHTTFNDVHKTLIVPSL